MMFKSAHASNPDWKIAVQTCIRQISHDDDTNFGFVYITETLSAHLEQILQAFRQSTGIENWVGSVGMGICTINESYSGVFFDEPAIAIMTAQLPSDSFILFQDPNEEDSKEMSSVPIADNALNGIPFVLVHADASNPENLTLVEDLSNTTGGFVVGGLTSSQTPGHQVSGSATCGGISGVLFTPAVEIVTSLSQGCQPIGDPHHIDRCTGNLIIELDGRSALEVLLDESGASALDELQDLAGNIHAALPISGSDTGDYLVRNLIGIDESHGIVAIAESVNDGDAVLFVRRDPEAARGDLKTTVQNLMRRAGSSIKGGLYISCIARGPNMFGSQNAEIELIRDLIGDIPLVGMYANGEFFNNRLYAYTGVLNLFI